MIWDALKLSLLVVSVATAIVGAVGLLFSYLLAKTEFRGKELLDAALTLPLVLPPTVTGYYLIVLLGRRGLIGYYIYEVAVVVSLPLMIKASRASIESVGPQYELASYTLGKGRFETFLRVTLPLARRGIVAGLVLAFARALGEFGATLMIAGNIPGKTQTMPLAIYEAVASGNERQAQILALVLTALSIAAVYLTNKMSRTQAHG
ncbi:MAG: molybdate ABC transporter permease subunit [Acidobacteria bacterium ACB1]|nr:molybdate ABC transporter permease subunit [Acidobacteria bacterium ACB1]